MRLLLAEGKSVYDLPLRVAYYARVSTEKDEQINSLGNQVQYFEKLIRERPAWTFAGGYIDEGISGTSVKKRESFLRMLEEARQGKFDFLITKEISRFSRNTLDSIRYTQELLACGVGVLFQSDNINTLLPDAELRLTIMASIAQDEVRKLSERVTFGFQRAKEQGKVLGQAPMGYLKSDGVLAVDPKTAPVIQKIFERYGRGDVGLRALARELEKEGIIDRKGKMLSYHTLHGILTNPKYKGFYCGGKTSRVDYRQKRSVRLDRSEWMEYRDERIPQIVSEELWDRVNALIEERGRHMAQHKEACQSRYPYSGKIFCGEHGTAYHRQIYRSSRGERECWNCRMYRLKGRSGCSSPAIYGEEMTKILQMLCAKIYQDREEVLGGLMKLYSQCFHAAQESETEEALKNQREKLFKKQEKLLELAMEELVEKSEFARRSRRLKEELEQVEERIAFVREKERRAETEKKILKMIRRELDRAWEALDDDCAAALLERAVVHREAGGIRLEIYLRLGRIFDARADGKTRFFSFREMGISQAQVSRLEKSALKHMQKYV